jgi:hypothetical protein
MSNLVPFDQTRDRLERLAARHRNARGVGMQLVGLLGTQAENLLERLPNPVRAGLDAATARALESAMSVASASRTKRLPDTSDWLTRAITLGTGAVGGLGGLPSALAELPVTTTVLLRAIQGIAVEHGIDPQSPEGRAACLQVFAAAGPMEDDDGTDLSFLTLRLTLSGGAVSKAIAAVAPRLSVVLGQKLATQSVPLLGAAAGAATNYVFTSYYQDMARVQFGLMQLSRETGRPMEALVEDLRGLLRAPKAR